MEAVEKSEWLVEYFRANLEISNSLAFTEV
jgi:hypothetical protein